ncbi:MAG: hypothetical protein ACI9WU_002532 [Myxococcota bacterium]
MAGSVIVKQLLEAIDDPRLRVDFVWTPIWSTSGLGAAMATMSVAADPRARVWFDATKQLSRGLTRFLDNYSPIWDVYLIYAPDAQWHEPSKSPGPPAYMEHQLLTIFKAGWTYLDQDTFEAAIRARLEGLCLPD